MRRLILSNITPPPTAENELVIDSITFEVVDSKWAPDEYYAINENIPTIIDSLEDIILENGTKLDDDRYELNNPDIELYLFDYKIPVNSLLYEYGAVGIYSSEKILPDGWILFTYDFIHCSLGWADGGWTFDHIPTTKVEAIMFVEFAKQYGVDTILIDNCTVELDEINNKLYIINEKTSYHYTVYGKDNGDWTGVISKEPF